MPREPDTRPPTRAKRNDHRRATSHDVRAGIDSTTRQQPSALAEVAAEDGFAKAFIASRGTLDPNLDIGF